MITCKNCKHVNLDDSLFCEQCGEALSLFCAHCQKTNQPGATYCRFCGLELEEAASIGANSPPRETQSEQEDWAPNPADRDDLIADHRKALRDYAGFWFDSTAREEVGMSEPEAAYHLCMHAGFLERSTADSKVLAGLVALSPSERVRLIAAAASYADGLSLIRTTRQLLEADVLEPEQIEQAADLLLARDGAEEVLRVLRKLAISLPDAERSSILGTLATAEVAPAEIDDLLQTRPDVLSLLAPLMSGLREQIVTPIDPIRQWWFSRLDQLDAQLDALTIDDLLPIAETEPVPTAPVPATTLRLADVSKTPPSFVAWEQSLALAASSGSPMQVQPFQVSCAEDPTLGGTMLVLPAHVYQFLLQHTAGGEMSRSWDGSWIAAFVDEEELARAELRDGHAVVQASRTPSEFRLMMRDDRCWTLRLDASKGSPG